MDVNPIDALAVLWSPAAPEGNILLAEAETEESEKESMVSRGRVERGL